MLLRLVFILSLLFPAPAVSAGAETEPSARVAAPGEISLLTDALHKVADDLRRWAYTEHRVIRDSRDRIKTEQLLRYDPSKP